MIEALVSIVLLVVVATLAVALGALQSSRRAEHLGEDRYELLRDQQERLQLLREERRMLVEELEREAEDRRQLIGTLMGGDPQLAESLEEMRMRHSEIAHRAEQQEQQRLRLEQELRGLQEELELERRKHQEAQRRAEGLEQEHSEKSQIEQEMERLERERQRLTEDLEKEREERTEIQRQAERWDQERKRLEQELQRLQAELDRKQWVAVSRPDKSSEEPSLWRSRPVFVVGVLLGGLVAWIVSLVVALNMLTP